MNLILYPLAAIGAAATATVAVAVAISRQARRLDDDYLVGQLHTLAAATPPALTEDNCLIDWDKFDQWMETL